MDLDHPGVYHVFTRCVRRAWLCGLDPLTGRSFDHRRQWIEDRILFLAERFAVAVHGYAVMSNHYHLVIEVDPLAPQGWSDETVARRWLDLFPGPAKRRKKQPPDPLNWLLANSERLALLRQRLGSLSWFMRLLNEPMARQANREDACRGRFWESRFDSKALLDDAAWLAATAYVDLNPVRAGLVSEPTAAPHTSIRRRCRSSSTDLELRSLGPIATGLSSSMQLPISLSAYCALLRFTAQPSETLERPTQLPDRLSTTDWRAMVAAIKQPHRRAFGRVESLKAYAAALGQRRVRGMGPGNTARM